MVPKNADEKMFLRNQNIVSNRSERDSERERGDEECANKPTDNRRLHIESAILRHATPNSKPPERTNTTYEIGRKEDKKITIQNSRCLK
jgi:hypothetical protein